MTQREEFVKAVEEFEDAVVAERDCAGGVPSFLTEKTIAARGRLLQLWDEREKEQSRLTGDDIGFILSGEYGPRTCPCQYCMALSAKLDRMLKSGSPREERSDV